MAEGGVVESVASLWMRGESGEIVGLGLGFSGADVGGVSGCEWVDYRSMARGGFGESGGVGRGFVGGNEVKEFVE